MNRRKWMQAASAVLLGMLTAATVQAQGASGAAAAPPAGGKVTGIEFVGRSVRDLDKSVTFYKSLGFTQDTKANPAWRTDEITEKIYGIKARGVQTRMAKMAINSSASGKVFTLYLREMKGIERRDLTQHTPWEPGATHFGLVVPDANRLWDQLKTNGTLNARSWDGKLIVLPGQTKGGLAYLTDPDGLDIEIIDRRPATPGQNGQPGRPRARAENQPCGSDHPRPRQGPRLLRDPVRRRAPEQGVALAARRLLRFGGGRSRQHSQVLQPGVP